MNSVTCVTLQNQARERLHGLLHAPSPGTGLGVCILLLSPGIKGRVGPHRLYLKLANRFVGLGFHVLRFDFYGLGDSEGRIAESQLVDVYNTILSGRYVGDTIAAMNWMQSTHGIGRFIGSGLCGGSISALLTAEVDSRIECLLGIGLPTALEGGSENWGRVLTQYEISVLRGYYVRKLTDPKSWLRLVSGKSSYGIIWRTIQQWLQGKRTGHHVAAQVAAHEMGNTNPRFASAFIAMLESSRPMLLVFSQADRLRYEFEEHFEATHAARVLPSRSLYKIHVIPNANHVMSDAASVNELLDVSVAWLAARYDVKLA